MEGGETQGFWWLVTLMEGGKLKASDGWLHWWKGGNSRLLMVGYIDGRGETTLPSKQYLENQILLHRKWLMCGRKHHYFLYNADEFGLFYQCVPNKTYQLKFSGGKLSKVRITGMASAHAAGDKLPMFVIGNARKPRCFKNLPLWMGYCSKSGYEGRNVALVIDNCPAHPHIENLKAIKLFFYLRTQLL